MPMRPPSAILFPLAAVISYLLGCCNGSILVSRLFYHDDVRSHGSGNAGLTNFYRTYGARLMAPVAAVDLLKMLASVLAARLLLAGASPRALSTLFAGLFCVLGHLFPVFEGFRGGKGVLTCGMLVLLLDWRVALAAWGVFLLVFLFTRYVSLSSCSSALALAAVCALVYRDVRLTAFSVCIALLVIAAHRSNLRRLISGTESRFSIHSHSPEDRS